MKGKSAHTHALYPLAGDCMADIMQCPGDRCQGLNRMSGKLLRERARDAQRDGHPESARDRIRLSMERRRPGSCARIRSTGRPLMDIAIGQPPDALYSENGPRRVKVDPVAIDWGFSALKILLSSEINTVFSLCGNYISWSACYVLRKLASALG